MPGPESPKGTNIFAWARLVAMEAAEGGASPEGMPGWAEEDAAQSSGIFLRAIRTGSQCNSLPPTVFRMRG